MNPKNDPLVKATKKAYRESAVGQIESLLKEERRWKSKETMASNKLRRVRETIAEFGLQLAKETDAHEPAIRGPVLARKGEMSKGIKDDLSRPIMLHCCKDGTITYRTRGQKVFNGVALPVFSVDTEEQAKALQTIFCSENYTEHPKNPGHPWFVLNQFAGTIEDLDRVRLMFREAWEKL